MLTGLELRFMGLPRSNSGLFSIPGFVVSPVGKKGRGEEKKKKGRREKGNRKGKEGRKKEFKKIRRKIRRRNFNKY